MLSFHRARFLGSSALPGDYPRHGMVEVALAGRSNVGKSSLINALTSRRGLARVSKTPGRTQTINFFAVDERLCLVDLPGYGYARVPERVRAAWGPMVEAYLDGSESLAGILVLIDGRHGPTSDDMALWRFLTAGGRGPGARRIVPVATKWDKVNKNERRKRLDAIAQGLGADGVVPVSAESGEGLGELRALLASFIDRR